MNRLPDMKDYPTPAEWQKAMQDWYNDRRIGRQRDQSPVLVTPAEARERLYDDWEVDWRRKLLVQRPPARQNGDDLALVQMIKEDIKEAELLGWKILMIEMEPSFLNWLVEQQPPALGEQSLCGIRLCEGGDNRHGEPYHIFGTNPHSSEMDCYTCWQAVRDGE